jgi:diamine N-acetyltransferase
MQAIISVTIEQIPYIQKIANSTWPSTFKNILSAQQIDYMLEMMYSTEILQQQLQKNHHFFLFFEDNSPLGFIGLEHNCLSSNKTKIHKIYIIPEAQGKGIGKKLIDRAENEAKAHQDHALFLNVNRYNQSAIAFYQSMDFEITRSEDIDIGNGFLMEDYVMEKLFIVDKNS